MRFNGATLILTLVASLLAAPAGAMADLITNGGFEDGGGSLTGWTVANQPGGGGDWFVQTGTASPLNGVIVPAPPEGSHTAMTDTNSPGSHVLYQDFFVPTGVTVAVLSFQRFINSGPFGSGAFASPDSLDFNVVPNQQARVDLMLASADPFSVASGDILTNVFQTQPGDPQISGYTLQSADLSTLLSSLGGQTLRLRFSEVDNQGVFLFGVDGVSLRVSVVPEPGTLAMLCIGVFALVGYTRRRQPA